jgi:riboflavin kinase/FMN adenylyltransferase
MQVFTSTGAVPASYAPSVIAIGNFDGVHRGHLSILKDLCGRARARVARAVAITFDPHPLRLLRPHQAPKLITPLPERLRLLAETGLDATLVLPFTREFSEYSAAGFAEDILVRTLGAIEVHEGDSFRFGYGAQAGMAELRALGQKLGFEAFTHPVLTARGLSVSSSQIRTLIAEGAVSRARALLGRPFAILSTQTRGRGIGTRLLVPTVNLAPYSELLPAHGVYVTRLRIGDDQSARCFNAVTNAGNRPTFGEDSYAVESYLLDYDPANPPEITPDTPLELSFLQRIRAEQRFPSPETLKQQISRDVAHAQRYFRLAEKMCSPVQPAVD